MPLFLIFVAIPIIEIALFIQVGGWLGLWPTLAIVILTAAAGTIMLRRQGMAAMRRRAAARRVRTEQRKRKRADVTPFATPAV